MQTMLAYFLIFATVGYNIQAQQIYRKPVQIASKPAQNEYVRLSEIPFENAVRAVITPQRDYVPIHEPQRDVPPPQRPQPVQQQPLYNPYNLPQTYANLAPMPLIFSPQYPVQQTNAPMSFQYMTTRDYPNEVYNFLYHTRNAAYAQGNTGQYQASNNLQQTYDPNLSGYRVPVSQIPVMSNNFATVLPQSINQVPVYNFQSPAAYNNFRPSTPISQNIIDLIANQNQAVPVHRFRTGKSANFPNNVQYVNNIQGSNGFVPSSFVPIRTQRMISPYDQGYMESSHYISSKGIDS